jgi:predicted nucleotidyltransferase component of viral defense system
MLSLQTIVPDTLELLKALSARPELRTMRLVGGTSLALQYGHRTSVDLDFFGHQTVSQDELIGMVSKFGEYTVYNHSKSILQVILNGVKVDFVDYSCYDWIDEPVMEDGITLASPKDIAALKVNAIEGRGTKKDFVDIYVLLQHYSLDEILEFYKQKYPNYSIFRALRSLTYFEDAEPQAMPKLFIPDTWEQMKKCITEKVNAYQ